MNPRMLDRGCLTENMRAFEVMEFRKMIACQAHLFGRCQFGIDERANTKSEGHLDLHAQKKVVGK